ncbi:PREDICTED: serum amyloid P-component [Chrysochloris asiatica]|uniref:Pentraxin family member n=1 Tax=Chrysochloris asiatica TaxID=185453 RepID=A0A9B0TA90_CHRAS|nr:PREDICTED: serum amyloid P-component [Chrysochloris asiatica]
MEKLLLWVSIFITVPEAFGQTDLTGKVFVFPRESSTDHVSLITQLDTPLKNVTLCFRAYSDLSRPYSLFSYNVQDKDNELLVFKEKVGEYSIHIGKSKVTYKVIEEFPSPVHICASWESSSGIAELWVNGNPAVRKGLKKGYSVGVNPKIILGQEQDGYGSRFDKSQSFVGEIGDLYMWDSVLTPEEVQYAYQGSLVNSNILNWKALNYELKGYVIIKNLVWK